MITYFIFGAIYLTFAWGVTEIKYAMEQIAEGWK
jgi:hypothetical protein